MKNAVERTKTHISGLDGLIEGGVPTGSSTLITGSAGTGKTITGLEFILRGARYGQKGLYVSFEENRLDLVKQASEFGWDADELERKGMIKFMNFRMSDSPVGKVIKGIEDAIREEGYERVVIDSITVLGLFASVLAGVEMLQAIGIKPDKTIIPSGEVVSRGAIMGIIGKIKSMGVTSLVISELPRSEEFMSRDRVSEYVCDGIIRLAYEFKGKKRKRSMEIVKMRLTNHDSGLHEVVIKDDGLRVK